MNNFKYKILLFPILALLAACGLMDQDPFSEIDEADYPKNTTEVNANVIGCYNGLHKVMYYEWAVTELRTDNSRMYANGSATTTSLLTEELDQGTITTTNEWMTNYWESSYNLINRCNRVLTQLDVVSDPDLKIQYAAEARFLRAHVYFNLIRLWGPVFLVTEPLTSEQARYRQRSTLDEIYDFLEDELREIVTDEMLPMEYDDDNIGRATLTAARAILAKVVMTRYQAFDTEYLEAKTLLEQVLLDVGNPTSGDDLEPFDQVFSINNEMNKEIIFTVRYLAGGYGIGSPFGNMFAPTNSGSNVIRGQGRSYNYPSDNIIAAFDAAGDDVRKEITLAERYWDRVGQIWVTTAPCRYNKKFLSPVTQVSDGENDWPIIRVGDILLLYAEVINELGTSPSTAINYLNMTRERAGLAPLTAFELTNKYDIREAIREERRLELAFENHRWFDLLRWGIAAQRVSQYLTVDEPFYGNYTTYIVGPIAEWQTLLPIPQKVHNINPEIAQNFGY